MIEPIIQEYLKGNSEIAANLAVYNGSPAVFDSVAPPDTDPGWQGQEAARYPRLIYRLDRVEDTEKMTAGNLLLHYIGQADRAITPEEIERMLKKAVDGYFFSDEADTITAGWRQAVIIPETQAREVKEYFDVFEFPAQPEEIPDPVAAVNQYVKSKCQNCTLIGRDRLQSVWLPTKKEPAVCTRITELGPGSIAGGYHVTWYDAAIEIQILCPDNQTKLTLVKTLAEGLSEKYRLILPDQSPFLISQVTAAMRVDPLKSGQLIIKGSYGILRTYPEVQKLKKVSVKEEGT